MGMKREKEEGKKKKKNGRRPCCVREEVRRGAWTADEDKILVDFITKNGHETWRNLPKLAGLHRCGKSCRLRWTNYLRPDIRRGPFTPEEENMIIHLHEELGNKWAAIASHLEGRTDNDVKNFWNSHLRKSLNSKALHQPSLSAKSVDTKSDSSTCHTVQWEGVRLEAESHLPSKESNTKGDYFLHMWNSKVGESFRSINECGGTASHSPISQSSSSTKAESTSLAEPWKEDDSSDAMLKLLLDFPVSGNDMAFLEAHLHDVST